MKIREIAKICKRSKTATLVTKKEKGESRQFMGDGAALYLVEDSLELATEAILPLFDIPAKERIDWSVFSEVSEEIAACLEDIYPEEAPAEPLPLKITFNDRELLPLKTSRGIAFIQCQHLRPLEDVDSLDIYEREHQGTRMFAIKSGFWLMAIIAPCDYETQGLQEFLQDMAQPQKNKRREKKQGEEP